MPFDAEGGEDVSKEEVGEESHATCPDQKGRRQGWEKELADSFIGSHRRYNEFNITEKPVRPQKYRVS